MEIVKYSKVEITGLFSAQSKLCDMIKQVEKLAQTTGKVVCRIKVNGLPFSETDESRFALTEKKEINEIEVHLESLSVLVANSANSLREYIVKLKHKSLETSDKFRDGLNWESTNMFTEIIEGVQCLTAALGALKPNLTCNPNNSGLVISLWPPAEEHLLHTTKELQLAFESQDFVLVGDVLEYELYTSLEKWQEIICAVC